MLRQSLRSLWARKVRLLMSTFAIVLGVAFVAGSLMFTDTLGKAFNGIMNGTVADVNVRPTQVGEHRQFGGDARVVPAADVARIARADGVAHADGVITTMTAYVLDHDGKVIGGQGAPAFGVNYHDAPAAGNTPGLHVTSGRAPSQSGEVALDPKTAERGGYHVGDTVTVLTAGALPRYQAKLVGLASYANGSMVGSTLAVVDTHTAQQLFLDGRNAYTSVWVADKPGTSQSEVTAAVKPLVPQGFEAVTGKKAADEAASGIKKALSFITDFLLVFAGVALLVGSFLIVNTFGILVAQRSRELALLRALGASRRQVLGSVMVEALIVGLLGSVVGLGVGVLLAKGILALLDALGASLDLGALVLTPRTVVIALLVGVMVTALAAWVPARRAGRVAPVAAMRAEEVEPEQSVARRAIVGGVLVLGGGVLVASQARAGATLSLLVTGMLLALLGVIAATPVLARPVISAVAAVGRRRSPIVSRLALENSRRSPRRTAATAAALMIGLTLVTMMAVFGASASGSIDATIKKNFRGDFVVGGQFGEPISSAIGDRLSAVDGVRAVSRIRMAQGQVGAAPARVEGVDPATYQQVAPLTMTSGTGAMTESSVLLSASTARATKASTGSTVRVSIDGVHRKTLHVAGIYSSAEAGDTPDAVISLTNHHAVGGTLKDNQLYVLKQRSAAAAAVKTRLVSATKDLPTITVKDQAGYAAEQRRPIEQMLVLIYGLLGLAIVIAVLGIVNTLALSVIERTREIGLLRAVGLGRGQLRSMIRQEAVTISLVGAVIGEILGLAFGIAFQRSQSNSGVDVLIVPWGRLVVFLVLAALVGVLAAWWPARRAARLNVLDAIGTD